MTELSPQAQAVLGAYLNAPCGKPPKTWIAAALRAAANQMAAWADEDGRIDLVDILAIAAELEGAQ
jgi:hypothetical protein